MNIEKVMIGYDRREDIVYQVAKDTLNKTTPGVKVVPLIQDSLREQRIYTRAKDINGSTDFSLTRFLTPFLASGSRWAMFVDCDFVFTQDINKVFETIMVDLLKADQQKRSAPAVWVVKHDYQSKTSTKMGMQKQFSYPKKNWSSFMVFDCHHPALSILTPSFVNKATPADLHQFNWIDPLLVGELPVTFNFLVGEYEAPDANAQTLLLPTKNTPVCLHYTLGVSVFEDVYTNDYLPLWNRLRDEFEGVV